MFDVNQKARDSFMDETITLNGKPAMMCGRLDKFPSVTQLESPFLSIHLSWEHISMVTNNHDGRFETYRHKVR